MSKPMSRMLLYVGIFFFIVFGIYGFKKVMLWWYFANFKPPAVTISSTVAKKQPWRSYLTAVGSLSAINGVDLTSEVSGIVREIRFESGQVVKKGDVVVVLDTGVEQASLKDNQAKLKLAQINFDREQQLLKKNVTSQAAFDTRYAELKEAEANVESTQAKINQKTIVASFDGKLGIRNINLGEYISPGKEMVTLQSLNPLYVLFSLPEQYLNKVYIHQPIDVDVNLGDGRVVKGTITAINSKVDLRTRNILIQATIPNDDLSIYPGMYGLVTIWMNDEQPRIVVPQTAIAYSLSGDYVFVITDASKKHDKSELIVNRRYIKVGERRKDSVVILDGLQEGDVIVTSGQLKLQNGASVVIDNSVEL